MVPLSLLSAAGVMKASEKYYSEQQNLLGKLNGYVEEMYNGQSVVQSFNYQERAKDTFFKLNDELKTSARKAETTAGAVSPLTTLVNDLGYVLCAAIGCLWAIVGKITVGNVQAMLEYTWRFAEPFSAIAGMVAALVQQPPPEIVFSIFWILKKKFQILRTASFRRNTVAVWYLKMCSLVIRPIVC